MHVYVCEFLFTDLQVNLSVAIGAITGANKISWGFTFIWVISCVVRKADISSYVYLEVSPEPRYVVERTHNLTSQ